MCVIWVLLTHSHPTAVQWSVLPVDCPVGSHHCSEWYRRSSCLLHYAIDLHHLPKHLRKSSGLSTIPPGCHLVRSCEDRQWSRWGSYCHAGHSFCPTATPSAPSNRTRTPHQLWTGIRERFNTHVYIMHMKIYNHYLHVHVCINMYSYVQCDAIYLTCIDMLKWHITVVSTQYLLYESCLTTARITT